MTEENKDFNMLSQIPDKYKELFGNLNAYDVETVIHNSYIFEEGIRLEPKFFIV